ncbi:CPBP family glutamic-type intramembrane protease [Enterobacter hormaechei]|uniref:CPBP family glutamic-type intramembrane protease n=1 Tax=Enterobacter hormaechei TaxID=158836 RepID=UPI003D6EA989
MYRGCIFGVSHSIFNKKYIIPCILTSLSFCLMHGQYYNILDQSILFLVSILLLIVRIRSRGLFYPIIIHSCMNAFVLSLNF